MFEPCPVYLGICNTKVMADFTPKGLIMARGTTLVNDSHYVLNFFFKFSGL